VGTVYESTFGIYEAHTAIIISSKYIKPPTDSTSILKNLFKDIHKTRSKADRVYKEALNLSRLSSIESMYIPKYIDAIMRVTVTPNNNRHNSLDATLPNFSFRNIPAEQTTNRTIQKMSRNMNTL
jgi:hypothetical protein